MIGLISGTLQHIAEDHVVVDVGGVGYEVLCHSAALSAMPPPGGRVQLHTDLQLRTESLRLYGFLDPRERAWFRLLTGVQGVGAKGAIAILGTAGVAGLADAVALGDPVPLRQAPGVGPRIAARVVHELKNRAPSLEMPMVETRDAGPAARLHADAVSALVNLGYGPVEAAETVRRSMREIPAEMHDLQQVLRNALGQLGRSGA